MSRLLAVVQKSSKTIPKVIVVETKNGNWHKETKDDIEENKEENCFSGIQAIHTN